MGRILKAKRTTGAAVAAASSPQLRKTTTFPSSDISSPFSSNSSSLSSSSSYSSSSLQLVDELKQLWGRCTAAVTSEKLLLAAERLFERLSFALEQRGLTYPAEVVLQQDASSSSSGVPAAAASATAAAGGGGVAPGAAAAGAVAAGAAAGAAARPCTEGGERGGLSDGQSDFLSSSRGRGGDASRSSLWSGSNIFRTEEEKLCEWLQAAAKQFLLLLCELLDAEAEELQQGGLSFCMRIVAHTHRVQAAAALHTATAAGSSSSSSGVCSRGRYTNGTAAAGAAAAASGTSSRRLCVFPLSTYQLLLSRLLQAKHFSAVIANSLVQQFLLPYPDLRFYFLLIARKILDSQQQQRMKKKALLSPQQQQEQKEEEKEVQQQVAKRQWYEWPAAVGPEAAAQRMYTVLAALPVPQKMSEKKSRRNYSSSSSEMQGEADNSSSSSDSDAGCADSASVSESESSGEGRCSSSSSCGSSSSGSSSSDDDEEGDQSGGEKQQQQQRKKKRWKIDRLQQDRTTADYAVKSCYLLNINTRRCCNPSEYRRLLERVWLQFLRCSASVWGTAKLQGKSLLHHLLLTLPRVLLPYMSNPLLLADFFLEAFDVRRDSAVALGSSSPQSQSSSSSSGYCSAESPCNSSSSSNSSRSSENVASSSASQQRVSSNADTKTFLSSVSSVSPSPSSSSFSPSFSLSSSCEASGGSAAAVSTAFSEEAVLALSGLFYLLTQHRLGDPDALWESDGLQQQQQERSWGEADSWRGSPSDGETAAAESDSDSETHAPHRDTGGEDNKEGISPRQAAATAVTAAAASPSPSPPPVQRGGESGGEDAAAAGTAGAAATDAAAAAASPPPARARDAGVAAAGGGGGSSSTGDGMSSSSSDLGRPPRAAAGGGRGGRGGGGAAQMHFYGRLYELLTPAAFVAVEGKARRRFLRLLSLALRSPLLPTHLVASFLKKCCRVACLIPPGGAVYLAGLVFMLLRKHAAVCSALIDVPLALAQELLVQGGDPFNYNKLSLHQHTDTRLSSEKQQRNGHHSRPDEKEEEADTHAKRVKYTSLIGENLAVSGDPAASAAAGEEEEEGGGEGGEGGGQNRSESELRRCEEKKRMKKGQEVVGEAETGEEQRQEKEQSKEPYKKEVAEIAGGRAKLYGFMPGANLMRFPDTQEEKLFELVLNCAPGTCKQPVCEAEEKTAGVRQSGLLATECMRNQAQTALWELELLRLHYDPTVRQFVSLFDVTFSSSSATGKRARAAAAMAATLDPDDYCWLLDWGAMLQHECKMAAKKSAAAAAPPVASGPHLPPSDVLQLATAATAAAW